MPNNSKTYHQLKLHNNYKHANIAGILAVFGFAMLFTISFPLNLLISALFLVLAYFAYSYLKTSKPITLSKNHIYLGKLVNGFSESRLKANSIDSIELIHEIQIKSQTSPYMSGEVDVHSNYYQINMKDGNSICFDNLYDKGLQEGLKTWCSQNQIELKLDVKKEYREKDSSNISM